MRKKGGARILAANDLLSKFLTNWDRGVFLTLFQTRISPVPDKVET